MTEENYENCWGLSKIENGDVYDIDHRLPGDVGRYGERDVVCGRLVDGVVVPVAESLFMECEEEDS